MSHLFYLEGLAITAPFYLGLSRDVSVCVGFAAQTQCNQ